MASGFGETGAAGLRVAGGHGRHRAPRRHAPRRARTARALANFATGTVANFSTIFHELEARDGPVAIVSQSGANSQAIYTLLHEKGLGVRHVHATGNEADVTRRRARRGGRRRTKGVRLLLLYMEAIKHPERLAAAAAARAQRELPIVALKAGRTASGQKAASSHTGALATEDRVVDAFFERHAHLARRRPARARGRRRALPHRAPAARPAPRRGEQLRRELRHGRRLCRGEGDSACPNHAKRQRAGCRRRLPAFAALGNPIDVTGALLGNPQLFGSVLPIVGEDRQSDLLLLAMPVAGTGYDVPAFARDMAAFSADSWQRRGRGRAAEVGARGVRPKRACRPSRASARRWTRSRRSPTTPGCMRRRPAMEAKPKRPFGASRSGTIAFCTKPRALTLLARAGLPVVEHRLCRTEEEVRAVFAPPIVMKACSRDLPHKTEHGLVSIDPPDPVAEFKRQREKVVALGASFEGVIVARQGGEGQGARPGRAPRSAVRTGGAWSATAACTSRPSRISGC